MSLKKNVFFLVKVATDEPPKDTQGRNDLGLTPMLTPAQLETKWERVRQLWTNGNLKE